MAANELHIDRESFSCSICLDLLNDPVSIPCGHSYCMSCIKTHWDGEMGKQSYSCPQCRHRFTLRPVLVKNTMLSILMEGLKKSGAPAAPLSPSSAAHGHVFCDLCSGAKVKAVKSCLQCLVSYCKEHLQPHYDVAALKKHKLLEPTENLQENMCSVHDEVMKMFCRTDQQCICYLCSLDQHKDHHTVTAAAERTEKQKELQAFQQNILQKISHKEKDLDGLQHQLKNCSRSADTAVELSDRSLKELLHLLEKRLSLVKQQVRSQQEAEEHRVKELQDKVQQEISKLKRKFTELDTLSHSEDHVHFLHKFASLSKVLETSESVNSSQRPPPFQDMVTAAVSKLRSSLQETSLLDPPAASNKPQVKTAKTDGLPAGAQGTAASKQREQQPQPLQEDFPPSQQREQQPQPLQDDVPSSQQREQQPQPLQEDVPPSQSSEEVNSHQDRVDFLEEKFRLFPKGYFSNTVGSVGPAASLPHAVSNNPQVKTAKTEVLAAGAQGTAASQQDSEETSLLDPSAVLHKSKVSRAKTEVLPAGAGPSPQTSTEELPALSRRKLKTKPGLSSSQSLPPDSNISSQPPISGLFKSTRELREYVRDLTLDPQSLNDCLELSEADTLVSHLPWSQDYSQNSARFTHFSQVVSKQRLTGRWSWMVEFAESLSVTIAVAYTKIRRHGSSSECDFGKNDNSWALMCANEFCEFWHNGACLKIPKNPGIGKVVVYLDFNAGILSFYWRTDNELHHIHTVWTTFTKPLVAGFQLHHPGTYAKLCGPEYF